MLSKVVTIVIPCKNEKNYIGNLLDDLSQQLLIKNTRIIIADADSTDGTLEVIKEKKKQYPFLKIRVIKGGTVSQGRNNGAKLVKTPFVCFIDADVKLYSNDILIQSYIAGLNGYPLVTCKLKNYSDNYLGKILYWKYNYVHKILSLKYPFAIGAYFFVSTERFFRHNMFNENTNTSEDFLFSQNFKPIEFKTLKSFIGQDNRRLEKMGYFNMLKYLVVNFYKFLRKDIKHFSKDVGYWN
jgi:glycosyltransferase involved in cell wall biosynthesis